MTDRNDQAKNHLVAAAQALCQTTAFSKREREFRAALADHLVQAYSDHAAAYDLYASILRSVPDNKTYQALQLECAKAMKDDGAIYRSSVVSAGVNHVTDEERRRLARLARRAGDEKSAYDHIMQCEIVLPDDAMFLVNLAKELHKKNELDLAVEVLETVLEQEEKRRAAYRVLISFFTRQRRFRRSCTRWAPSRVRVP